MVLVFGTGAGDDVTNCTVCVASLSKKYDTALELYPSDINTTVEGPNGSVRYPVPFVVVNVCIAESCNWTTGIGKPVLLSVMCHVWRSCCSIQMSCGVKPVAFMTVIYPVLFVQFSPIAFVAEWFTV
jgi:hypothetical protein